MEQSRVGDRLTEQAGTDDDAVAGDQRTIGPVAHGHAPDAPDEGWVGDAEREGEHEHHAQRGEELTNWRHGDHTIPGRSETTRSMSLMPMNGAMTPPTP